MGYIAVLAAMYLAWFYPDFFSRPLIVVPAFSLLAMLGLKRKKDGFAVMILLMFIVTMSALAEACPSFAVDEGKISALYGSVIQDSSQKKYRSTGLRLLVYAAADKKGNLYSANGSVYVIAGQCDVIYGDEVKCIGRFSGPVFYADSCNLVERELEAVFRQKAMSWIKNRLDYAGDAGELGMRLLLGYGYDGDFGLSENARKAGLAHVLALSGMHLSIIASVITKPLSIVFGKKRAGRIVNIVLLFFSYLSGWRPSLVRAFIFRMLLSRHIDMEEAFMLSYILLFMLFPYAVIDLGAVYSFISLSGIFILSDKLDESIRSILPIPYPLSVSCAASASAIAATVPLTFMVFSGYQIGAIVTSFPFSFLISLYMGVTLIVLFIPCLSPILQLLYGIMEKAFSLSASFPEAFAITPYIYLVIAIMTVMITGFLIRWAVDRKTRK